MGVVGDCECECEGGLEGMLLVGLSDEGTKLGASDGIVDGTSVVE
jgi:hypothetical protein